MFIPLAIYVRAAIRQKPAAAAHAVGLGFLAATAINDALVGAGVLQMPYMLSLGFSVAVLSAGGVMIGRFLDQARALESLSRALESQVERRGEELARTQSALLQAEKLASLGRLAAGAAHELNNPCSVVSTNLAYLQHTIVDQRVIPKDVDGCLDETIGAAERIARIVRHLVDAGRTGGAGSIELRSFSLLESVEKAVASARVSLRSHPTTQVHGDAALQAQGDPALLQQIVVNLVTNAGHAVEPKGDDGLIRVEVYDDSSHVCVDVVDNGMGIQGDAVERVFEPFFSTKRPGQGMGLGLAVSLGLAHAQGGDILIASTGASGTTMRLRLVKSSS